MGKITYATMSADDPALHQAYEEGLAVATEKTSEIAVGDPRHRETPVGPVIDDEAVDRFRSRWKP